MDVPSSVTIVSGFSRSALQENGEMLCQKSRCAVAQARTGGAIGSALGMWMLILDGQSRHCGTHWTDTRCIFCTSPGTTGDRELVGLEAFLWHESSSLVEGRKCGEAPCALLPHNALQGSIACGIDTSHLLEQVLETNR